MVDLKAKSAADGLLPLTIGSVIAVEVGNISLTALAPFKGTDAAKALKSVQGLDWPAVGKHTGDAAWFGHAHILLMGVDPDPKLSKSFAVTDQTDAWVVIDISGPAAQDVLARLTPMDLRDDAFPVGGAGRTDIRHMKGAVLRLGTDHYRLMVFRSMAQTLVHDLKTAMQGVSALA